ncbi:hypothetical protein FNF27_00925 [Cafeteria roenbergensis]|nr:hypothetical protein FNF29_01171 [Cafeteria roenbergensis]KAA0177753.1 hypothetical protein FNF27_00925 [Cafeteria roenbergensis]|eukprot:KAA0156378.1 hypothetical protein FNF29_01171 [Cafeteria roenbergensis]
MGDVYDFVASETVSSSRTEAAYIERGPLVICSGGTNADFTASVASHLGIPVADVDIKSFADGETSVRSFQVMRGRDVFVVQSTSRPVNEAIIGLILTITAIRRAGANKITAVIPYYGYSRAVGGAPTSMDSQTAQLVVASNQAHLAPGMILHEEEDAMKDAPLSVFGSQGTVAARPISAADVARLLEEAGVDMVITVDLQPPGRGQIEGFFRPITPVETIRSTSVALEQVCKTDFQRPVVVAPHEDCLGLAREFQHGIERRQGKRTGIAVILDTGSSAQAEANASAMASSPSGETSDASLKLVGNVNGCDVIIVDGIIDTARSLCARARLLKRSGARRIIAYATHSLFSGEALRRLEESPIDEVITTDTVDVTGRDHEHKFALASARKLRRVSVAPLVAEAIERVHGNGSLQHLRVFDSSTADPDTHGEE